MKRNGFALLVSTEAATRPGHDRDPTLQTAHHHASVTTIVYLFQ